MSFEISKSDMSKWLEKKDLQNTVNSIFSDSMLNGPIYVEIHLTDKCNSSCYFCNQRNLRSENTEFSLDDFEVLISQFSEYGIQAIRLSGGGEPTKYPHLEKALNFIKGHNISVIRFDTNGIDLNSNISNLLVECGLQYLHISMQAPDDTSWSKITGLDKKYFSEIIKNIQNFKNISNNSIKVIASFVISELTYDKIDIMEKLCKELDIEIYIHDLNSIEYSDEFKSKCIAEIEKKLSQLDLDKTTRHFLSDFLRIFHKSNIESLEKEKYNPLACYAPWIGTLIKANGDVYPCCAIQGQGSIMGNIYKKNFIDIWNGEKYRIFRQIAKDAFFGIKSNDISENTKDEYRKNLQNFYNYFPNYCTSNDCIVKNGLFCVPRMDDEIRKIVKSRSVIQ
jgi:GTP 3',8-cyclase